MPAKKRHDSKNQTKSDTNGQTKGGSDKEEPRRPPPVKEKRPKQDLNRNDIQKRSRRTSEERISHPLDDSDTNSDDEDTVKKQRKVTKKQLKNNRKEAENRRRTENTK